MLQNENEVPFEKMKRKKNARETECLQETLRKVEEMVSSFSSS